MRVGSSRRRNYAEPRNSFRSGIVRINLTDDRMMWYGENTMDEMTLNDLASFEVLQQDDVTPYDLALIGHWDEEFALEMLDQSTRSAQGQLKN